MREKNLVTFFKEKYKTLTIPFIMIVLGIFIAIKPDSVYGIAITLIGIILMVLGALAGFSMLAAFSIGATILSIALFFLGLVCVINPGGTASFIIKVLGFFVLVNSILRIIEAYKLRGKSKGIIAYMANDILTAILGLVLLTIGAGAANIVFMVVGIIMAILGVSNLFTEYKIYSEGSYVNDGSDVVWEEDIR